MLISFYTAGRTTRRVLVCWLLAKKIWIH